MAENKLEECDYCGQRYFAEKKLVKQQLAKHLEDCWAYADERKARAAPPAAIETVPDEPPYEPPDAELRRKAKKQKES